MPALDSRTLLTTPLLRVRDVRCSACRGRHVGAAECDPISHIVIPYRGSFVRRVGARIAQADVNQALFFNAAEEYRIDHLTDEGDACLSLDLSEPALVELVGRMNFREPQRRSSPSCSCNWHGCTAGGSIHYLPKKSHYASRVDY